MTRYLTIDLIGRICLIKKGTQRWAVFLKANRDANFNTRRSHFPALSAPLDRVKSQKVADKARIAFGALTGPNDDPLAESRGIWALTNLDMHVRGVDTSVVGTTGRLQKVAHLKEIVESVNHPPALKMGILARDPRPAGIVARLKIPKGATIEARSESDDARTFMPGGHQQELADFIRVRMAFTAPSVGPSLSLKKFGASKATLFKFRAGDNLKITMSNLCRCVEQPTQKKAGGVVVEDREFVVFYKLLATPLPKNLRPIPQVKVASGGSGGVAVPECYRPGEGEF